MFANVYMCPDIYVSSYKCKPDCSMYKRTSVSTDHVHIYLNASRNHEKSLPLYVDFYNVLKQKRKRPVYTFFLCNTSQCVGFYLSECPSISQHTVCVFDAFSADLFIKVSGGFLSACYLRRKKLTKIRIGTLSPKPNS